MRSHSRQPISPNARISPYLQVLLSPTRHRSLTPLRKSIHLRQKQHLLLKPTQSERRGVRYEGDLAYQRCKAELTATQQALSLVLMEKQRLLQGLKIAQSLGNEERRGFAEELEMLYSLLSSSHLSIAQLGKKYRDMTVDVTRVQQDTSLLRYRSEQEKATSLLKKSMVDTT